MHAIKKLFSETRPQIFEDESVKQNISIAYTGLALVPFSYLKWAIFKKNQGRFHGRRTVFFLCVFVLRQFKEKEMVSGEVFFCYLRRNLMISV